MIDSIESRHPDSPDLAKIIRWTLTGCLVMVVLVVFWLGWAMANDTFDAYDYMAGARALAESRPAWYPSIRPFGPSLLGVGWAAMMQGPDKAACLFRILHLQSALLSLVFLLVVGLFFQKLGRTGFLLPLALLALCRLFPRYGWSFLSDIPAALLVTLAFLLILRHKEGRLGWLWAGICFGLAANFKFYLIAAAVFGALAWRSAPGRQRLQAWGLLGTALLTAAVVHLGTAAILTGGRLPGLDFWKQLFAGQLQHGANVGGVSSEAWWSYLPLFAASCGLLAPLFVLAGVVEAFRRRGPGERLVLIWLGGLGTLVVLAGHHEARYLFPVLPPLLWLLGLGVLKVGTWLSSARRDRTQLVIVVALASALWPALQEGLGLSEPWLRQPIQQEMCQEIDSRRGTALELVCVGPFYPLILAREVFSRHDDFYSVFHLGPSQIVFWQQRDARFVIGSPGSSGSFLPLEASVRLGLSPVVLASGYQAPVRTVSLQWALENPRPLGVIREQLTLFERVETPGLWSYCSREGEECFAPGTEGTVSPEGLLAEDWFRLGSEGGLQPLESPPMEYFKEGSGNLPPAFIRRRFLPVFELWPSEPYATSSMMPTTTERIGAPGQPRTC